MKRVRKFLAALLVLTLCMTTFAATALASQKVTVTSDECNLRSGPGLDYSIKEELEKGDKCTYLDVKKKDDRGVVWYKVKYDDTKGWVSSRVAKLGSANGKSVKTTGSVYVRSSASKSGKILGAVGKGVKLTYRGKTAKDKRGVKWYAVTYKGKNGWVSSKYAKLV